jgi:hypothetical protein
MAKPAWVTRAVTGHSPDWIKVKNPKHPSIERIKEAFS